MQIIVAGLSMSKLPDFEGLAMFAKVAEERSFAAAARAMDVSVATVSRAVTRLEERLGGRLFNRTSRRLALTDFGHRLAERASRIYSEAAEAEDFARETSSKPRGLVKLAAPLSFGARWVAPMLPEFLRQYPDIELHDIVERGPNWNTIDRNRRDAQSPVGRARAGAGQVNAQITREHHPLRSHSAQFGG
jgi:DNA-binding transcriptional LysR family regulator